MVRTPFRPCIAAGRHGHERVLVHVLESASAAIVVGAGAVGRPVPRCPGAAPLHHHLHLAPVVLVLHICIDNGGGQDHQQVAQLLGRRTHYIMAATYKKEIFLSSTLLITSTCGRVDVGPHMAGVVAWA
jgi:hypothetical protein